MRAQRSHHSSGSRSSASGSIDDVGEQCRDQLAFTCGPRALGQPAWPDLRGRLFNLQVRVFVAVCVRLKPQFLQNFAVAETG
jgi:hypothetical protein